MGAPKAPKDPEKKRPYFYIMRNKQIFGAKQPDGRGVTFIYEDGGRLLSSARVVGGITDEDMISLMKTAEGFRKLVHSIGVAVETDDSDLAVDFVFQMYGKKDVYGGGTSIRAALKGNGAETRIHLDEITWTEDTFQPGQIRFEFAEPEKMANVWVRFYLNDGFTAPEVQEETAVDFDSPAYAEMIARSLMHAGNGARILKAVEKARRGEDVTLAYIGGSITQGAGATPINQGSFAYQSCKAFAAKYGNGGNVRLIKAGVGGTPSELGMLRFDRDVLRSGGGLSAMKERGQRTEQTVPDIVVVEFAVNDEGDETKGVCYESLVRKILMLPNKPAVILLFAVFADDYNLQERLSPVGQRYDLPMVSVKDAVSPQFKQKEGRVLTKNQYFYDVFHPSNLGHRIMCDCIMHLIDQTVRKADAAGGAAEQDRTEELLKQTPAIGADFDQVKLLDKADLYAQAKIDCGGFTGTDRDLQCVEMDENLQGTPEFPYNWMYDGTAQDAGEPYFEIRICCKALLMIMKDSGAMDFGKADVFVDGEKVLTADPRMNGWTHCNPLIVFNGGESRARTVRVRMAEGDEKKKFTILGFGYVE